MVPRSAIVAVPMYKGTSKRNARYCLALRTGKHWGNRLGYKIALGRLGNYHFTFWWRPTASDRLGTGGSHGARRKIS